MEITTLIGFGMLVVFLLAIIIQIWKDNRNEKRTWSELKAKNKKGER
ncbi:putative holin-like toxin [Mucilaginibacter defluvii]